jgi:hypothetical protein
VPLRSFPRSGAINLVIDRSGLSIFEEGQWTAVKHGGKGIQSWRKLHLGVDETGAIVAQVLTKSNVDDATTGLSLMDQVQGKIKTVIADDATVILDDATVILDDATVILDDATVILDDAYDTRTVYATAESRSARVIVPPDKTAITGGGLSRARDRAVRRIRKVGRRRWKKEVGCHRQARVENAFFRFKTILGDRMRARGEEAQRVEAVIACNILNRLTELGRPDSYSIGM